MEHSLGLYLLIYFHPLCHLRDPTFYFPFLALQKSLALPERWMDTGHGVAQPRFKAQFYQELNEYLDFVGLL